MFERKLRLSVILCLITLTCGGVINAQRINDDLKPAVKPAPAVKSAVKPAVKVVKKVKKVSKPTNPKSVRASVKTKRNPNVVSSNAVIMETPEQIINRYMDFQQSASVTSRDWKNVIVQTAKTLQENPNHSMAKAQSLIAQGQIAFNEGSYPIAVSYFKSAGQILPTSSLPKYSLGKVYLANGQAKAAEQSFKEAIDQNEDFALAFKGMGDALAAQGEAKKAAKYFRKATETGIRKGSMP
ncbi:MAG: tetratricopeptide repeat protein [Acidobacteriota bacterium]|nr:tetratricopeptide repeat protein [Acidobacteriota bacterium]